MSVTILDQQDRAQWHIQIIDSLGISSIFLCKYLYWGMSQKDTPILILQITEKLWTDQRVSQLASNFWQVTGLANVYRIKDVDGG